MKTKLIFTLVILCFSAKTFAQDEESAVGYDYIINELSQSRLPSEEYASADNDPFSQIMIHAGIGWTMTSLNLNLRKNVDPGILQGIEINFGIDLFSANWRAEGSFRNYGDNNFRITRTDSGTLGQSDLAIPEKPKSIRNQERIGLSEFDLKLVYNEALNTLVRWSAGFGLSARYMNYLQADASSEMKYTTPAWVLQMGVDTKLSRVFTVGAHADYRSAMIDETIDTSALTAGLRLDAHF